MKFHPQHWPLATLLSLLLLATASCSKSKAPALAAATPQPTANSSQPAPSSPAVKESDFDACALLTKEEVRAVQDEPFATARPSQKTGGGVTVAQCYFELPTPVNSVVLTVTQKADGPDARDPREMWQELFHRENQTEKPREDAKEKERAAPEKVEGVGEEAFWSGTRVGGALHVLKGNVFIRISVGGAGDQAAKKEKSKALAQSVLKHL
ncbi:MAG: hypothetical protein DLM73_12215 [Chthoniobacterales bacterium]|nr:MAG: hypothetical protein DLM73_12215 [Chthoniobacterales bacterium]